MKTNHEKIDHGGRPIRGQDRVDSLRVCVCVCPRVLHLTRRSQLTSSLLRSGAKALQPVEDEQEEVLPSKAKE